MKEARIASNSLDLLKCPKALLDYCNILRKFLLIKIEILALHLKKKCITKYLETMLQESDPRCSLRSHENPFEKY